MVGLGTWSQSKCIVDLKSQTHFSSCTQVSHLTALCTAVLRQQTGSEQIVQAAHFLSSDPSNQGGPPVAIGGVWGRRALLLSADGIKRPPHPPAALPAMLHTLQVIYHYKLDCSAVHSTALCHASLTDTMPKITSFSSPLVNKRAFATLKQSWVFNSC